MKGIVILAAAALGFGYLIPAAGQPPPAARQQIETSYKRENAALAKENVAGVMVHYAPDFVYKGPRGETYRAPQLQSVLSQMFAAMSGIRNATIITRFVPQGKGARARVKETLNAVFTPPGRAKPGKLVIVDDREDVWARAGNAWVKKSSRSFKQTATLDGKPLQM
jgi:hypothetical protein